MHVQTYGILRIYGANGPWNCESAFASSTGTGVGSLPAAALWQQMCLVLATHTRVTCRRLSDRNDSDCCLWQVR